MPARNRELADQPTDNSTGAPQQQDSEAGEAAQQQDPDDEYWEHLPDCEREMTETYVPPEIGERDRVASLAMLDTQSAMFEAYANAHAAEVAAGQSQAGEPRQEEDDELVSRRAAPFGSLRRNNLGRPMPAGPPALRRVDAFTEGSPMTSRSPSETALFAVSPIDSVDLGFEPDQEAPVPASPGHDPEYLLLIEGMRRGWTVPAAQDDMDLEWDQPLQDYSDEEDGWDYNVEFEAVHHLDQTSRWEPENDEPLAVRRPRHSLQIIEADGFIDEHYIRDRAVQRFFIDLEGDPLLRYL